MNPTIHESTLSALERAYQKCQDTMNSSPHLKEAYTILNSIIQNDFKGPDDNKKFRLYAKFEGDKKSKAVNLNTGFMVNSLKDATIFNSNDIDKVKEFIAVNTEKFPNISFEIKEITEKEKKEPKKEPKEYPNNLNDLFDYMVKEFSEKEIISMFKEVYSDEIEQDIEERIEQGIEEKLKEISKDESLEGIIKVKVNNLNDKIKLDDFLYTNLYPNYSDQLTNLFIA